MPNSSKIKKSTIYLDYQASTPTHPQALARMLPYFSEHFANPHSNDHFLGWESTKATEKARLQVAKSIQADSDEIIFTSGASEANNLALKGMVNSLKKASKTKIIVSEIEHKCVLESVYTLKDQGFNIHYLKPDQDGLISPDDLAKALDENTGLVSIMLVNNEIGTIQPIKTLAEITKKAGALFHTDAAQAPTFMEIDVKSFNVDFLSLSSHKVYGPKGIGALYIARDLQDFITPLIHGGGQENSLRSGTLPTPLCVGFGEAMEIASQSKKANAAKLKELSNLFVKQLEKHALQFEVNGIQGEKRHPGNLNLRFPGINNQSFLQSLQPFIAASTGSACNSGMEAPSYVLEAIGLSSDKASESIRFSFGLFQSDKEIYKALEFIHEKYQIQLKLAV
jgi:cysteine desulfurase